MALLSCSCLRSVGCPDPVPITHREVLKSRREQGQWHPDLVPSTCRYPPNGASLVGAGHSKMDPQHVLAGDRLLAGCAHHGLGALLLTQAGSAQKVAAGQLVHRLLCVVGRKCSFAGGTFWTRNTPRMLGAGVQPPGSTTPSCAELPLGEPGSEGRHGAKSGSQGNFQTLRQLLLMGHWTC